MSRDTLDLRAEIKNLNAALAASERLVGEMLALHSSTDFMHEAIEDALAHIYSVIALIVMKRRMVRSELLLAKTEALRPPLPGEGK